MSTPDKEKPKGVKRPFDFFTIWAHDLNTPLNAVESYLNLLSNRILGDEIAPYIPLVEKCIGRINEAREIVKDAADLGRIRAPETQRQLTTVAVFPLVEGVITSFTKEASERNISLSLGGDERLSMAAVAAEMKLMLRHLISNAIKYNKDKGTVTVTIAKRQEKICKICIEVADTGIGMSPEEQRKIFQEFVRIKNRKTTGIPGSGLGLAIVKRLADLYGGEISVVSSPDRGSRFSLHLPLA